MTNSNKGSETRKKPGAVAAVERQAFIREIRRSEARFEQITERGGTGLGMTIVQAILDRHQGEIRVESQPRKETRVSFTLRVKSGEEKGGRPVDTG